MNSAILELVGSVRNPFPSKKRKKIIEFSGKTSIKTILLENGFLETELEFLIPIANGKRTSHDYILQDKDHIWISLPIGGG
ncbi:hypothetical protein CEE45_15345 [Candidatus Heimdallarchaeota archaeon B3_Heim]|nr:MAG: hypothetical protein CEE45_15345 [Candidatus Heimdallarchaeota archaeon B3_Heim]